MGERYVCRYCTAYVDRSRVQDFLRLPCPHFGEEDGVEDFDKYRQYAAAPGYYPDEEVDPDDPDDFYRMCNYLDQLSFTAGPDSDLWWETGRKARSMAGARKGLKRQR